MWEGLVKNTSGSDSSLGLSIYNENQRTIYHNNHYLSDHSDNESDMGEFHFNNGGW